MIYLQLIFLVLTTTVLATTKYAHLKHSCIDRDCTAQRIALSNAPVNLFDAQLIPNLHSFFTSLQDDNTTKVVVISSDIPGFFGDHLALNLLSQVSPPGINATKVLEQYFDSLNLLVSTPIIFISEINGRALGTGNEVAMRSDMRFAGPKALFGAPEAAGGILHVGGLQQLVRVAGPAIAMEYLLSSAEVSAKEAERVGWVNRAFPTAKALRTHLDGLASRIALFHVEVIRAHKQAIAESAPTEKALGDDLMRFYYLASLPYERGNLEKIAAASRNDSRLYELDFNNNIVHTLFGKDGRRL